MTNPNHLKHLADYDVVFVDLEDTLIQSTLTMDKLSNAPVSHDTHPAHGRWADLRHVHHRTMEKLDIPLYAGADLLLNMLLMSKPHHTVIMSAMPPVGQNRQNAINALGKWNDHFKVIYLESSDAKAVFLRRYATKNDVILDDDLIAVKGQICDTLLVNSDINQNGCSLLDLANHWRT